ncbi:MAG: glycosyltransferase family 9 protein [bacterium]|nr:glycosyltransferase family 9 protein [bacterium]
MEKQLISSEIKKILIIHLRRIGDILLCTPSIREIRERYPDSEITFLTEEPFYDVLCGNPYLDDIVLLKQEEKNNFNKYIKFLKMIHGKKYDLVIDFYGNPRSSLISFITGARYRLGFNYRVRKYLYNIRVPVNANNRYVVQVKFDLLRKIGVSPESEKLDLFIPPEVTDKIQEYFLTNNIDDFTKLVGFSPTSRRKSRRWFPERFAELGDRLINSGYKVIFIWGPGEKEYIDLIISLMKQKPLVSFETTVKETAGILKKCRVLVTNFNGSMHLAVAVGTPTIGLCEPSEVPCWNPPANDMHLAIYKDVPCVGCAKKEDCPDMKCMDLITVDEVETAVYKMINKNN